MLHNPFFSESLPQPEAEHPKSSERTLETALLWAVSELEFLGAEEARLDAEWLLSEVTGLGRFELYFQAETKLTAEQDRQFEDCVGQRKKRIPAAYILKKSHFFEEVLSVSPAVLIPRPETEFLVEKIIERSGFEKTGRFHFLDLGTGSGAIAVALLKYFEKASGTLSDICPEALEIAAKNGAKCEIISRAKIVRSDLFEHLAGEKYDLIVSNPPYVSTPELDELQPEVRQEPRQALDGGFDGLLFYRKIIAQAKNYLKMNGLIFLEIGAGQWPAVRTILRDVMFSDIVCFKDYSGIERVVTARMID